MFSSKIKPHEPEAPTAPPFESPVHATIAPLAEPRPSPSPIPAAKPKPAASVLSSDLTIQGNVLTSGDIQIEGIVEGDIRAHTLVVGETATVKGEVIAEEVVVHGRVAGRLRGLKVRLSTSARCEGDIVHKTIAIESGAHFEGSVQRHDDPIGKGKESGRASGASTPAITAAE